MKRLIDLLKSLLGLQLNSVPVYFDCPACGAMHEIWFNETEVLENGMLLRRCDSSEWYLQIVSKEQIVNSF